MPEGQIRVDTSPVSDNSLGEAVAALADVKEELRLQRRSFKALLAISDAVGESRSIEDFFQRALGIVEQATSFETIVMRLYEQKGHCYRMLVQRGLPAGLATELECISADRDFFVEAVGRQRPIVVPLKKERRRATGYSQMLCVPLLAGERVLGSLELVTREERVWSEDQIGWLALVGHTVGAGMQHVEQAEQRQTSAILQERSWLAQELHDGPAQLLTTLSLWVEEAQFALDEDQPEAVSEALARIDRMAREACAMLRQEMVGLRQMLSGGEELQEGLSSLLDCFQRRWHIKTSLRVGEGVRPRWLAPYVAIELLRIAQEALVNIQRHAGAGQVVVELDERDGCVTLIVADDGIGFDPKVVSKDHLGLRIMRDRARSVGGLLIVESSPGEGTHLEVRIPRQALRE